TVNRIRRFGQGMVIATEYAGNLSFLYSHFIHTPTSATRYGAITAGLDFAISAHAKDIWTSPGWELAEKLEDAAWCVTCTKGGVEKLQSHASDRQKVNLVYHGIDLSRFSSGPNHGKRDGKDPGNPVRFLTVGRAVPKKGIDTLISALAKLPDDLHWRWTHIGGGPQRGKLVEQASSLGIADKCEFKGALAQAEVLETYRDSDLFVLPCRIDETGDRDGLPNVIIEAQSQGLAVLTTEVSGIPELIVNGENGIFVEPDNVDQLTVQLANLAGNPDLRLALGNNGEKRVRKLFDHLSTIPELERLLQVSLDRSTMERSNK
ncbi:MAG: glycosyltransferase family 4 protein, partial [Rhizobiaceae bacterium]